MRGFRVLDFVYRDAGTRNRDRNRRKSPSLSANIPVLGRISAETGSVATAARPWRPIMTSKAREVLDDCRLALRRSGKKSLVSASLGLAIWHPEARNDIRMLNDQSIDQFATLRNVQRIEGRTNAQVVIADFPRLLARPGGFRHHAPRIARYSRPSGVSSTRRLVREKSAKPSLRSNSRIRAESAGCDTFRRAQRCEPRSMAACVTLFLRGCQVNERAR